MKKERDWMCKFIEVGAHWKHCGDPRSPHVKLTSGFHSNEFFNGTRIIENYELLEEACRGMLMRSTFSNCPDKPQRVFGPALGASPLAQECGRLLGVPWGFTEPVLTGNMKKIVLKRFYFEPGTTILVVEDAITTGTTTRETIAQLEEAGACVLPYICTLVTHLETDILDKRKVVALAKHKIPVWLPEECPLCAIGSEPLSPPKDKDNWRRLTAPF